MLCKRVIASMVIDKGMVVKGADRVIGTIPPVVRLYNARWIDELCVFNRGEYSSETMSSIARDNFVPLTYVGGIDTPESAIMAIRGGADKVGITWDGDKDKFKSISKSIGRQSVVCVCNSEDSVGDIVGIECGEVIFQDLKREATMKGMNHSFPSLNVPSVLSCGCSGPEDAYNALCTHDGVAIGALFSFTHETPLTIKKYLKERGIEIRWPS